MSNNEHNNKILEAALKYHDMGWTVLPAEKGKKHPIVSWKEYQYKKPTREQIIEWFKDGKSNIFLVTGKISGICVVDVDKNKNGDLSDEAEELTRKLPLTLTSITGGGGFHYFFKYPARKDLGNFVGKIPGIDFRGEGGGVILPPSIHESGNEYFFDIVEDFDQCNLWEFISELPYELFKDCFEDKKPSLIVGESFNNIKIAEGKRNAILMHYAGSIFKQFANRPDFAKLLIKALNNEVCDPPLTMDELEKTILTSSTKYHPLKDKNLISWIKPLSIKEILEKEFEKDKYIVDRLIPLKGTTVISGEAGHYKTWNVLDISTSVASGGLYLNHFSTLPGPVWIIDKENIISQLKDRLNLLGATIEMPIFVSSTNSFVLDPFSRDAIIDIATKNSIQLIVFDSLRRIFAGDENNSNEVSQAFELINSLHDVGLSVLITHHHKKTQTGQSLSSSNKMRGSSDILASIDSHLIIQKVNNDTLYFEQNKSRYDFAIEPFTVSIATDGDSYVKFNYSGESNIKQGKSVRAKQAILEVILSKKGDWVSRKEILEEVSNIAGCNSDLVDEKLKELLDKGRLESKKDHSNASGRLFYRIKPFNSEAS